MLVFVTQAKYLGLAACKNPEYAQAQFVLPESYKGLDIPIDQQLKPNCKCLLKAEDTAQVVGLKAGEKYQIKIGVSVSAPKGNYGANLQFDLLQVLQPAAAR